MIEHPRAIHIYNTVEPPLNGPPLNGHTLLNGHMSKSQKYLVYIIKDKTSIERPPLLSGRGHLRVVPSSAFLIITTTIKPLKNLFVEILINTYPLTHRLAVI